MSNSPPSPADKQPSALEGIKAQSDYLRGEIAEELARPTDHFSDVTAQLLKFHGMYQQEDRDRRCQLGDPTVRSERAYRMMVRTGVPGGHITADQLLAHLDLCDELGHGTLRITTRQNMQIHGIAKARLREAVRRINETGLSTLAACGDVRRNVMCCPAPYYGDPVHGQMQWLIGRLSAELAPRMPAYRQIWLGDQPAEPAVGGEVEPLYGRTYLPRKFKVAVGLPGDNCVDIYTQDVGLLAICENFNVMGYNILVGGGMGRTPGRDKTFAALAQPMAMVSPNQAVDAVRAILAVFRDCGDRSDRKRARMKYLVADWGIEKFKARVEQYLGYPLSPPQPAEVWDVDDHLGWHEQGDGRWFYGLYLPNGRIFDNDHVRLKSALREICRTYRPSIALTPSQGVLLCDVRWEDRPAIEDLLHRHGVKLSDEISNARRWSAACVSLPTCPLAITESERALPEVVADLEREIAALGLDRELFSLRMTGCANGCSRPYNADIGLVGRSPGRYAIYLGGARLGNRLAFLYRDAVPAEQLISTLVPVLAYFKTSRQNGETLGDFCARLGRDELLKNV
jgi:sulfite reductase (ferredoxin)